MATLQDKLDALAPVVSDISANVTAIVAVVTDLRVQLAGAGATDAQLAELDSATSSLKAADDSLKAAVTPPAV